MDIGDIGYRPQQRNDTTFPRPAWIWLSAAVAIVVLGAVVAAQPLLALALAGAGAAAGILAGVARVRFAAMLVVTALLVAGVVDLPRRIVVGPTTSYAWITVALAGLLVLVSVSRYVLTAVRGTGHVLVPLYAFAAWALLSVMWFRPSFIGVQNTLVYAAFAALVPVTAAAVIRGDFALETARRAVTYVFVLASFLYVCSVAVGGLESRAVIGTRSYALLGVVAVAWGVAHARFGYWRIALLAPLSCVLILLSLSRTAFAASLLIIVVASLDLRTPARFVRSALVVGSVAAIAFFAVTSFGPLATRFEQGDLHSVGGGLSVNTSGRAFLWGIVWHSYLESPVIGKGVGSSEVAIERESGINVPPHNDFLRVAHDLGAVGFVLLVVAFLVLIMQAWRARNETRADDPAAPIHLAALLSILGLLLGMTTDNAIAYLFVVAPVAAIVGLSLGAAHRGRLSSR
jgi:O-antigen ligase